MDIEKLIERLRNNNIENNCHDCALGYYAFEAATALSTLQVENEKLRVELERMKKIMRDNGIMTIPPKYPGWPTEWNIPKPRGQKED